MWTGRDIRGDWHEELPMSSNNYLNSIFALISLEFQLIQTPIHTKYQKMLENYYCNYLKRPKGRGSVEIKPTYILIILEVAKIPKTARRRLVELKIQLKEQTKFLFIFYHWIGTLLKHWTSNWISALNMIAIIVFSVVLEICSLIITHEIIFFFKALEEVVENVRNDDPLADATEEVILNGKVECAETGIGNGNSGEFSWYFMQF